MKRPEQGTVSVDLEVPFHDVDAMNIVWHGNYLKYLEIARTELMRSRNLDVQQIVAVGYRQVVIETHCRHVFPLRYGDKFRVHSWFHDVQNRLNIRFEIINLTHNCRSFVGHTILVTTDPDGRMLLETPDAILRSLL
jgi:acyl-CoA thioester hydrolase